MRIIIINKLLILLGKLLCYIDISHPIEIIRGGELKEVYIKRCKYCKEIHEITVYPPTPVDWGRIRFPIDE